MPTRKQTKTRQLKATKLENEVLMFRLNACLAFLAKKKLLQEFSDSLTGKEPSRIIRI